MSAGNSSRSFQKTVTISKGLSDFHKMVIRVQKSLFIKLEATKTYCKDYKKSSSNLLRAGMTLSLDKSIEEYDSFEDISMNTLNTYALMKKRFVRANKVPYMIKALRKAIMKKSENMSNFKNHKQQQQQQQL